MKKTLALVMVVKNEEKGLEKAILSCKDFVDEIVIAVDSSSSDRTLEIASQYTKNVKRFNWCDDFAWARNFAHENVKSDFILFLDGHEFVVDYTSLDFALEKGFDAFLVTVRMDNGMEFRAPRIYKNGLQFEGKVHEKIQCQHPLDYSKFVIQHDRLNGQSKSASEIRTTQRDEQMGRIMLEQIKKDPSDVRSSFHLALFYESKGEYRKALKYQKLYLKHSQNEEQRWFVYFHRAICLSALNRHFFAFWAINKADDEIKHRWESEKMKGIICFDKGKYGKAIQYFVNSFNDNEKNHFYKPWPRDDAGTWNLIGESFYNLGVLDKASTAFELASDQSKEEKQKKFFKDRADLMKEMSKGRN